MNASDFIIQEADVDDDDDEDDDTYRGQLWRWVVVFFYLLTDNQPCDLLNDRVQGFEYLAGGK